MQTHPTITVIGGGVIGLTTAYALLQAGHAVTLVERHAGVGRETSFANGGQLSYRYVSPLANAGVAKDALGWMLQAGSPISLRPRLDPHQWRWLFQFLRACNKQTNRNGAAALLEMALASQSELQRWRNDGLGDFLWRQPGKLVMFRDAKTFAKAAKAVSDPAREQVLTPSDCATVEPAFAHLQPKLAGGIFSPEDEVADCHKFCEVMLEALQLNPQFRIIHGHAVLAAGPKKRCVVTINGKPHDTDHVVLAAGNASRQLALALGFDIPIYPLKGYSLTQSARAEVLPNVSVTDYDRRIVYARLQDTLRIAAMVDIGAQDVLPNPRRLAQLKRLAAEALPQAGPYDRATVWAGMRPATPTGVPIISGTRYENLWLNVGHGALGFTLSVGAALQLRELIDRKGAVA